MQIRWAGQMGDRREFQAFDPENGRTTVFNGSATGLGPVFMSWGGDWVRVDSPERFGPEFTYEWVAAFYAPAPCTSVR